ncbi:MAG: aminotransferase class I/II-fold pyridoxal phosphate-dependent enzyme [Candidatus Izemoplasma sp.]|nr:aminotransferase class I/II-fold pyridoxal phosphate-dependent enzyme [Candidatus Izemoplasma sp.]
MNNFIKSSIKDIDISGIRQFNTYANQFPNTIKLTLGELDFHTPKRIKDKAIEAINQNKTTYTTNQGISALRQKITQDTLYNEDDVILTVGTTEGLAIVLKSIVDDGDEVIIPTPGYVGYAPLIHLEGGKVVEVDTTQTNHTITKEALEKAYTDKTKALLVTSPNNPTGHVLSTEEMAIVTQFVTDYDLLLISDEIYQDISFEQSRTFRDVVSLKDRLVVLGGFSKSHAMTGFRIGYIISHQTLIKAFLKVHQYTVTSTSTISQYAALEAIDFTYDDMIDSLKHRRDYVIKKLETLGISYIHPDGAFYVFYSIADTGFNSLDYCKKLVKDYGVALIPGSAFLGNHDNYVRLSYTANLSTLEEALNRIKAMHESR